MSRRVVITGMGLVTPVGNNTEAAWQAMLDGTSGGGRITQFDTSDYDVRIACEVKGFDPLAFMGRKESRRTDRYLQLSIAAAAEAMQNAGLEGGFEGEQADRAGVIMGVGIGGLPLLERQHIRLRDLGPDRVSPFVIPMFIPDMTAGLISIRFNARGPNFSTVSACASSGHALGMALNSVRHGETDIMISGGAESVVTPLAVAGFANMKALSRRNDEPLTASRPFCRTRNGFVIGEGAGVMVLESLESAMDRGAEILGELAGFGQTGDAHHITAPPPDGVGAQGAMVRAIKDAGLAHEDIDYINAHGTSTPANDVSETVAVKAVFGEHARDLVVGSTKSMVGHTLGAAGAIEGGVCVLAARDGMIPPTINLHEADPECDLQYAHGGAIQRPVRATLSNSFGFGGHNACLVFKRWDE